MKISEYFGLNKIQKELNFIDVIIEKDLPLFIDPHFLSIQESELTSKASYYIHTFFQNLLNLIKNNRIDEAKFQLKHIGEINEIHLGLSKGKSKGRGIGERNSSALIESFLTSKAITSGLVENIEDTRIFIKDIGADKISDMCANIIKEVLLEYTEHQCDLWGMRMQKIQSGYYWSPKDLKWISKPNVRRLVIDGKPYLLVPKEFVTYKSGYTPDQYRQHFILNFLQSEHLKMNTNLVQVTRDKKTNEIVRRFVTKKSIIENYESKGINIRSKEWLLNFTLEHKEVLDKFKKKSRISGELFTGDEMTPEEIAIITDALIHELKSIRPGNEHFKKYEDIVKGISELLFFPDLRNPKKQKQINDGRKVVDLVFTNDATSGVFHKLKNDEDYPCQYIAMECKNYSKDISNPELDQMTGRFSNNRGKVGFIFCRKLDNRELFLKRTQDVYKDGNGLIIHLTDSDLIKLLNIYKQKFELSYRDYISDLIDEVRYS